LRIAPALLLLLICTSAVRSEPEAAVNDDRLQVLLNAWKHHERDVRDWHCRCEIVDRDSDSSRVAITNFEAFGAGRTLRRWDTLGDDGAARFTEMRLGHINWSCDHVPKRVHTLDTRPDPAAKPQAALLKATWAFVWDQMELRMHLTAAYVLERCRVQLLWEDSGYAMLEARPLRREDRNNFTLLRFCLSKQDYSIQELRIELPYGLMQLITYKHVETNLDPPITRKSLTETFRGADWQYDRAEVKDERSER